MWPDKSNWNRRGSATVVRQRLFWIPPTPGMSAKFCWIICSLSADNPAASAGCARIISSLDPRSSSSTDWPRKMRKYGRAVAEIELEAVVGGMLNRTLMPVLSVSRKRPPDKLPPGIKETTDPAVTAIGAASPLLAISPRRPSSSEILPRLAARPLVAA